MKNFLKLTNLLTLSVFVCNISIAGLSGQTSSPAPTPPTPPMRTPHPIPVNPNIPTPPTSVPTVNIPSQPSGPVWYPNMNNNQNFIPPFIGNNCCMNNQYNYGMNIPSVNPYFGGNYNMQGNIYGNGYGNIYGNGYGNQYYQGYNTQPRSGAYLNISGNIGVGGQYNIGNGFNGGNGSYGGSVFGNGILGGNSLYGANGIGMHGYGYGGLSSDAQIVNIAGTHMRGMLPGVYVDQYQRNSTPVYDNIYKTGPSYSYGNDRPVASTPVHSCITPGCI